MTMQCQIYQALEQDLKKQEDDFRSVSKVETVSDDRNVVHIFTLDHEASTLFASRTGKGRLKSAKKGLNFEFFRSGRER